MWFGFQFMNNELKEKLQDLLVYCKEIADLAYLADRQANPEASGIDLNTKAFRYIHDELKEIKELLDKSSGVL